MRRAVAGMNLARSVRNAARRAGPWRRGRFAPGPLRVVRRRKSSSAAAGALLGGLVAVAVLAAFSLPLVFTRGPAARAPLPAEAAASVAAEPVRPGNARVEAAALGTSATPAPASEAPARAGSRLELPVLEEAAAEIDLEPAAAAPAPPPRAFPLPPRRPPASAARATP
ncbi:hypothetical protein [Methylobacterium oxalidis]|uniref:hypothetical protein n=1 Tax=Methylobacterium oxalidis TaxID=944322 RepID=UPI00331582E5